MLTPQPLVSPSLLGPCSVCSRETRLATDQTSSEKLFRLRCGHTHACRPEVSFAGPGSVFTLFEAGSVLVSVTCCVLQSRWPISFQTILPSLPPISLGLWDYTCPKEGTQAIHLGLPRPRSRLLFSVCPCDPTVCPPLVSHPLLVLKTGPLDAQDGFKLLVKLRVASTFRSCLCLPRTGCIALPSLVLRAGRALC